VIPQEEIDEEMKRTLPDLFPVDTFIQENNTTKTRPSSNLFSLTPEAGRQQLHRIERLLQSTEADRVSFNLKQTLRLNKNNLESANPMTFLITSARHNKMDLLHEELLDLEAIKGKSRREQKQTYLINIQGYSLSSKTDAEKVAAQIMKYEDETLLRRTINGNVTLINWDPAETSFTTTLMTEATQR